MSIDSPLLRSRAAAWVESAPVQNTIIALIVINAVTLGLQTSMEIRQQFNPALAWVDKVILSVFVAEIGIKLYALRRDFFRSSWNLFDFLVVGIALIPASGPLAVLRALRILRVLRLISMVPRLRFVVEALLHAIPGIGSIAGLMVILFYVSGVMATGLFGAEFSEWFGSIGASMYTLFQIMTLESWSMGIVRPVMEVYPRYQPWRAKRRLVIPGSREAALLARRALRQRASKVGIRTRRRVISGAGDGAATSLRCCRVVPVTGTAGA